MQKWTPILDETEPFKANYVSFPLRAGDKTVLEL